jgi:hypothetical protein
MGDARSRLPARLDIEEGVIENTLPHIDTSMSHHTPAN